MTNAYRQMHAPFQPIYFYLHHCSARRLEAIYAECLSRRYIAISFLLIIYDGDKYRHDKNATPYLNAEIIYIADAGFYVGE